MRLQNHRASEFFGISESSSTISAKTYQGCCRFGNFGRLICIAGEEFNIFGGFGVEYEATVPSCRRIE